MNDALKTIFESAEALNENGLQVLALIAGVIRQVAPSAVEPSVALPETEPVEPLQAVDSVAEPLPEASPVESSAAVESSPTYRLVLNVPEIGLKGFAD